MLSSRIRNALKGFRPDVDLYECTAVQLATYRYIPSAREAWESGHPATCRGCRHRQESILVAGASIESKMLGVDYMTLMRDGLRDLHFYLDSRS